jgi:polysaccharide chain length determinant protein (PEP-CTERM system associated)
MTGLYDEIRLAIHSVWNRRWLALGIAWALCLLGWLAVALIPSSYESKARVLVRTQSILNDRIGVSASEQRKSLERLQQTLTSSTNLEKIVRGTSLGRKITSEQELAGKVDSLRTAVEIKADPLDESVLNLSATLGSPSQAREVVQKMIDVAEEDSLSGDRRETRQSLRFLDTQLETRRKQLQEAEARRVDFETKNLGMLPGVGSVSTRMAAARSELSQIDSQLIQARSSLAALNSQLAGTPPMLTTPGFSGGGGGGGGNPALAQAQAELASMRARGFTDSHPDIIAIRSQISILRSQPGAAPSAPSGGGSIKTPNPAYSSLQSMRAEREASVTALSARKSALEADIASLAGKQSLEPGVQAEMERISRDYDVLKTQYDKLLADREAIRLRGQVESQTDAVQFQVIDRPSLSRTPAAPNRLLLLALVLFAGLGAGVGGAFAMGHLQTSYATAAKLEKSSGLPVIGSISQMLTSAQRVERKRKMKLFAGGTGALFIAFAMLVVVEMIQRGIAA